MADGDKTAENSITFFAPAPPAGPADPHKITFQTPGIANQDHVTEGLEGRFPHTTLIPIGADHFEQEVLAGIQKQVQDHGTLTEVVINAHGHPWGMTADGQAHGFYENDPHLLHADRIMAGIEKMQAKLDMRITDRIVFNGCDTFTNLAPEDVAHYRETAKKLGTEIVGNVELGAGGSAQVGEYYQFTKDGSVKRDPELYAGDNPEYRRWLAAHRAGPGHHESYDETWAECHVGQSQEKGAACQTAEHDLQDQFYHVRSSIYQWEIGGSRPKDLSSSEYKNLVALGSNIENSGSRTGYSLNMAQGLEHFLTTHPSDAALFFKSPEEVQGFIRDMQGDAAALKAALPPSASHDMQPPPPTPAGDNIPPQGRTKS